MPVQQLPPPSADMQASAQRGREETDSWLHPADDVGGWLRYRQCQPPRLCTVLTTQARSWVSLLYPSIACKLPIREYLKRITNLLSENDLTVTNFEYQAIR